MSDTTEAVSYLEKFCSPGQRTHQVIAQIKTLVSQLENEQKETKGQQDWINDLCKELCRIEDALGFRQDQHNRDGSWRPTIECCLEKIRDYVMIQDERDNLLSKLTASEVKVERMKEALEGMHELCGNYFEEAELVCARDKEIWATMLQTLSDPHPPLSTFTTKERNKKELGEVLLSSKKLGSWLSAALDDGQACNEFKADIRRWFASLDDLKRLTE